MKVRYRPAPASEACLANVYVWESPVRICHWLIAGSIWVLSITGLYMGNPMLTAPGAASEHFLMGTAKLIHFYAAIVFTLSVLTRVVWMFIGNRYAAWDKFVPARAIRRKGLGPTLRYYLFALRLPPGFVGHNPLAGLFYTLVFVLYGVQIATGLGMYAASAHVESPLRVFTFFLPLFGGLQTAHWIHHVVMWLLWMFIVHHVYSAVLMSQVEENATVESIFSGHKFVPREDLIYSGYRFVDRDTLRGG
ncbi:MAG: Ni/Fe-hydrogenase, b-type cytochrome subunit [Acidobacteriota bacterium]|nr:Ni/Fe-hydrogenase, b-type cytochrome subunit [Acidobacteriota bacterium]MDH3523335.1 Ni/Fe-hydrogenase, b-type cytochrome subunit [Acidobacteriota bacterium]